MDETDETKQEDEPKPTAPERLDEDGLPLDREPTLDDVRGNTGEHPAAPNRCSVLVVLMVLGFWILRAYLLR